MLFPNNIVSLQYGKRMTVKPINKIIVHQNRTIVPQAAQLIQVYWAIHKYICVAKLHGSLLVQAMAGRLFHSPLPEPAIIYLMSIKLQGINHAESLIRIIFFPLPKAFFIRPFEKRAYYAVAMSVRPSVRPRFSDFSSTCFEISIWNLVYTFSRWNDMSSLSSITIGTLLRLQPKVGQTHFLQSWPPKSR